LLETKQSHYKTEAPGEQTPPLSPKKKPRNGPKQVNIDSAELAAFLLD